MKFSTILSDPPWQYHGGGKATRYLQKRQYPAMPTEELMGLPVADVCNEDAILLLWCPWPKIPDGCAVLDAWGFRYATGFPWIKQNCRTRTQRLGPGYHVRQVSECLLIGVRGNARAPEPDQRLPGIIHAPVTRHSRKPEEQYIYAERYPGPYLEMFWRPEGGGLLPPREGWTVLGDAVSGRDIRQDLQRVADLDLVKMER